MSRRVRTRGGQGGVALLMVVTTIAVLAIVVVEFSSTARTHLNQGVNLRDQARASTLADTSLVMARACLDNQAWGAFAAVRQKLDMEKLCNLMLGIFIRARVDLPIGGLSVELEGIQGVGISGGEIEDIKMTPEEGFIGLAGLYCPGNVVGGGVANRCPEQRAMVARLRSMLCDPAIAHVFETERPDGQRYTREDIIANLIDWVDADDTRTAFALDGQLVDSTGENEDGYYARMDDRYLVKDEPFDSIEELRLVRGIDDELFAFLKDKVSVHSAGRVNVNAASPEVLAALLRSAAKNLAQTETQFCGKEVEGVSGIDFIEHFLSRYAQLIVEVRQYRQMTLNGALARPFKNAKDFRKCAETLTECWYNSFSGSFMAFQAQGLDPTQVVDNRLRTLFGIPPGGPPVAAAFQELVTQFGLDFTALERMARVDSELFRLEASGRVGNMTRRVFAILKQEPQYVRTLYYRED